MLRRGILIGLIAALTSSAPGLAYAIFEREPLWRPIQAIATLVGVVRLEHFDSGTFLLGGALHLTLSAGYALLYLATVGEHAARRPVPAGAIYGVLIFAVNFGGADILGVAGDLRAQSNLGVEAIAHVVFGVTVAVASAASYGAPAESPHHGPRE